MKAGDKEAVAVYANDLRLIATDLLRYVEGREVALSVVRQKLHEAAGALREATLVANYAVLEQQQIAAKQ